MSVQSLKNKGQESENLNAHQSSGVLEDSSKNITAEI